MESRDSPQDCHGETGQGSCCTPGQPCWLWAGDCDSDSDCVGDLVCGTDNCHQMYPGVPSTSDCCVAACLGVSGDGSCCTSQRPCGRGQGDCDTDAHCAGSLTCGTDNCQDFSPSALSSYDCCV